jgi:hypothetical protein
MDAMDVKGYCESLRLDLIGWKAKIDNLVRALDKMPSEKKTKALQSVNEVHGVVEDIEERIDKLEKECPVEWGPEKVELEKKFAQLRTSCELMWPDVSPDDLE